MYYKLYRWCVGKLPTRDGFPPKFGPPPDGSVVGRTLGK